jgi:hypothetical protein
MANSKPLIDLKKYLNRRENLAREIDWHGIPIANLRNRNLPNRNHAFLQSRMCLWKIDEIENRLIEYLGVENVPRFQSGTESFFDFILRSNMDIRKLINRNIAELTAMNSSREISNER